MKTRKAFRIAPLAVSLAIAGGVGTAQTAEAETTAAASNLFSTSCNHYMKQGERNGCVTRLQNLLNSKNGAGLKADGVYGDATVKAVKNWQDKKGVDVDGKAGPQTKRTLEGNNRAVAYWANRLDSQTAPGDPEYDFGDGHGSTPGPSGNGIDCSGFTRWVASGAFGKDTLGADDTVSQRDKLDGVSSSDRQAGDLVFFWGQRDGVERIVHVGVYAGDDKVTHSWGGDQNGIMKTDLQPVLNYYAQYSDKGAEYARF